MRLLSRVHLKCTGDAACVDQSNLFVVIFLIFVLTRARTFMRSGITLSRNFGYSDHCANSMCHRENLTSAEADGHTLST